MSLYEMKKQRSAAAATLRRLANHAAAQNRTFSPDEQREFDAANTEFERLHRRVEIGMRGEEVRREMESTGENFEQTRETLTDAQRAEARALALQAWCRRQMGKKLTPAHVRACKLTGLNPRQRSIDIDLPTRPGQFESRGERQAHKRAMSATVGSAGAFTVSPSFVGSLEKALKAFNGVRQVADVIRTDTGAEMPWPTVDDTGNRGQRIGENTQIGQQDPKFGQTVYGAFKYTSNLILAPSELLEDSAFELETELSALLGERIGRIQEDEFTNGTGNSMPLGVVPGSALGATAANAASLVGDDFINLIHSVDPAYRNDPSFALMMHDLIFAAVRKIKDLQGRYIFEEGQNGMPPRIKGVRVVINQNMPTAPASGARTVVAGPFRKYKVRDVRRIRIRRFDERYGDYDQTGFVAFMRSDARPLNAGTGPIRYLVHP
ncbi:phage major capsid protein [bacterium]|nr:phage major capsid protein [bacterium]